MIGTVESLGVFLLAILPGFVAQRAYRIGRPSIRATGTLQELGVMLGWSVLGWLALYYLGGRSLLATLLDGSATLTSRLDAFGELTAIAIAIGFGLGLLARAGLVALRAYATREDPGSFARQARSKGVVEAAWARVRLFADQELLVRSLPARAWDRLLARLSKRGTQVLCQIRLRDGHGEVLGVFAREAFLDWKEDGGDVLLVPQVVREQKTGKLRPVPRSRGVFVPGDQIATLSVVELPPEALSSVDDG